MAYLVKITTWENDADNYNTVDVTVQSEDEVNFLIEVSSLFNSGSRTSPDEDFGNSEKDPTEAVSKVIAEWKERGWKIPELFDFDKDFEEAEIEGREPWLEDWYNDALYDIGISRWNEGEYWRVFDDFKVFEIPEPGLKDVTQKFK